MSEIHPLLKNLGNIVDDLWGDAQGAAAPEAPAADPAEAPENRPEAYQPSFPPFEQLWTTADDAVDWTDALAHDRPTDGLTSPRLWDFFHRHAAQVLAGDAGAYVEVLRTANPLGDLSPYADAFDVEAVSADRLRVSFLPRAVYMTAGEAEVRRYLCAVSLRAARDLMALLPVREVEVAATWQHKSALSVVFSRSELQKVRFSFIDPVVFVTGCGAAFA